MPHNYYKGDVIAANRAFYTPRNDPLRGMIDGYSIRMMFPGLRAYWSMSSVTSSGSVSDFSEQGRLLTPSTTNPTYGLDTLVPYVQFDGANNFLYRSDDSTIPFGTEFCLSFWFYVSSVDGAVQSIASKWDTGQEEFRLFIDTDDKLYWSINTAAGTSTQQIDNLYEEEPGGSIKLNTWMFFLYYHHLHDVGDPLPYTFGIISDQYFDRYRVVPEGGSGTIANPLDTGTSELIFGARRPGSVPGEYFHGRMSNIVYYHNNCPWEVYAPALVRHLMATERFAYMPRCKSLNLFGDAADNPHADWVQY